ncbi:MAG TPA: non-canonical purine NTP pyrophosphatase [Candidatus Limnocylindrales bacterium]|nr:non-canonical purine NTP pyrophosphatase [Candidatus Limnocylindrales bacterium]
MNPRRRLLVATGSPHKLAELRDLLRLPRTDLVSLADVGIDEAPVEDGATFAANALIKARFYAARSGLPTLADDSGLEVEALDGGPGVRTRRYAGEQATDEENDAKLLAALRGLPDERRAARYVCVLCFLDHATTRPLVRTGLFEGRIARAARGTNGFGYDPIFEAASEPPGGRTVGQWSPAEKAAVSHRARAAHKLGAALRDLGW